MKSCPRCGREYQDTTTLCPADGTVLEKSGDELVGQMLTDRYRIDERISEGGMGTVYRATHVLMDKRVAIKVLHPSLAADDKIVARFSREARAASRISHPHALNVTDFGESESGVVFLVMEYLDGRTLKEVIQSEGPMPLMRVVEIIRQVTGALDAAHTEGVVHRDLKSDNIMLMAAQNGSDWAKVLDFGIAKIKENTGKTDPGLTAPNLIIGTPQYMSPEQCSQASEIDSRSDIYSLGIIIYEMLTGHVPFMGDSPTAIMMKHLQEPPPSVLEERDDLPPQVGMVITSALAKRPEDRFQTAGELSEALTAAANGKAASAVSAAATNPASSVGETNRIVVPTDSNEAPRKTRENELDEETVIRARPAAVAYETRAARTTQVAEPPRSNPWRIIIPALAGLIVLVGVIYAVTYKGSSAEPSANQPGMTADPNSKPVQPAPPPTGNAEQGIVPSANSNTSNSNTGAPLASGGTETKPPENKNGETAGAENANTGNANRKERGQKNANDNQGAQTDNSGNQQGNQDQSGDEPPPPPKSNKNQDSGDTPSEQKPKPKKAEPTNLPPPPPTSNISTQ